MSRCPRPRLPPSPSGKGATRTDLETVFGQNTFSLAEMQARLPKPVFKALMRTLDQGTELDELAPQLRHDDSTLVGVERLVHDDLLLEVELVAAVAGRAPAVRRRARARHRDGHGSADPASAAASAATDRPGRRRACRKRIAQTHAADGGIAMATSSGC